MDSRYLYRAKRTDNGEWIIGYLYRLSEKHPPFIMLCDRYGESHEVEESTICKCTGLRDNTRTAEFPEGKLIWENDIVTGWFDGKRITGYIMYGSNAHFFIERKGLYGIHLDNSQDWLEVIGNIFDNLELLEVGE